MQNYLLLTSMPPSRKIKGGTMLWFINSTYNILLTINSQILVVSGQLYAITASTIGIFIMPTLLANADTVAFISDQDKV